MTFSPSQIWFNFLHSNLLIYNICWEDSKVDRELLSFNNHSNILMITSAGDNALDYLLDSPASVQCVDINPKQNALLDLKLALINNCDHQTFFDFFGKGRSENHIRVYHQVKENLKHESRRFWDEHIRYFDPTGRGLFYHGGSGTFARFLNKMLSRKDLHDDVLELIYEENEEKRSHILEEIEAKIWSGTSQYLWKSTGVLSLAGIPKSQREALGDIDTFIKKVLRNVFVKQSARFNPYWKAYIEGSFTRESCPDYLKPSNFEILKQSVHKLNFSSDDLISFLENDRGKYSHFVLLDHMDWLAEHNQKALIKEWELMLQKAQPGAEFLFRSAYDHKNFLPEIAIRNLELKRIDPEWLALNDRVGTYTSTFTGKLKN